MLETIAPYFPLTHPEDRFTLWARFNRELLCYAELFLEKKVPKTPRRTGRRCRTSSIGVSLPTRSRGRKAFQFYRFSDLSE
jgi:hypothetical protein